MVGRRAGQEAWRELTIGIRSYRAEMALERCGGTGNHAQSPDGIPGWAEMDGVILETLFSHQLLTPDYCGQTGYFPKMIIHNLEATSRDGMVPFLSQKTSRKK